jgi:hypothetical protein
VANDEVGRWVRAAISEYRESGTISLPKIDTSRLPTWKELTVYWYRLQERVSPTVMDYQGTMLLLYVYRAFASLIVSKETFYRLTQNPYRRAIVVASRESDPLMVGVQMFTVSLWSSLLFFAASYSFDHFQLWYPHRRRLIRSINNEVCGYEANDQKQARQDVIFRRESWKCLGTNCRRYFYSAIGGGLGSIIWPGFGTLIGIGLGDGCAEVLHEIQEWAHFSLFHSPPQDKRADNTTSLLENADAVQCGCCQIATFSSNPNHQDRAPISSRNCGHSICKSCVQKCHLFLMERTSNYEEWIKCPLCNADKAFSAHDQLVNRSLCDVLAWVEDNESVNKRSREDEEVTSEIE